MLRRTLLQKSSQFLLDLLLPPRCLNCQTNQSWLCQNCLRQIAFITTAVCQRCGAPVKFKNVSGCEQCQNNPFHYLDGLRAAAYFENNPMRSAIHFLKYRNHQAVVSILGQILVDTYRRHRLLAEVVAPVPLHPTRLQERGYNQSELLAREVAQLLDLSINTHTLYRNRQTESQVKLSAGERYQNVAGAFSCRNQELAGRKILLIDDVSTTGSTLEACAAALKASGVAAVWGLTLARPFDSIL